MFSRFDKGCIWVVSVIGVLNRSFRKDSAAVELACPHGDGQLCEGQFLKTPEVVVKAIDKFYGFDVSDDAIRTLSLDSAEVERQWKPLPVASSHRQRGV